MAALTCSTGSALLLLGRLDGSLSHSNASDIWLARARLEGAAGLSRLAGAPISVEDLQAWISARGSPPRHAEGLDDPISVAALFHFGLTASEATRDPLATATLNVARTLLDDRDAAAMWAADDLARFSAPWRQARAALLAPYPAASLEALAERLLAVAATLEPATSPVHTISTIDGRQLQLDARSAGSTWILACHLPAALHACGLATRILPSLVGLPRYLPKDPAILADQLVAMLFRGCGEGLKELDRLETRLARLDGTLDVTRRSKAPLLARLELAYPNLRTSAVARLLGISHQGATKLIRQLRDARAPTRSGRRSAPARTN